MNWPAIDPLLSWLLRLSLALLFATAAWQKLRAPAVFREQLRDYRLLPAGALGPVSALIVIAELGIATALSWPAGATGAAFAAAALLCVYAAAIGINLARGRREIDCGCGGPASGAPISGGLVLRNLALAACALLAAVPPAGRPLVALDWTVLALSLVTVTLLFASANILLANAARQRRLWPE